MSLLLNGSKTITIAGTEMQCIEIYTGEAYTFPFAFTDSVGNPINISSWTLAVNAKYYSCTTSYPNNSSVEIDIQDLVELNPQPSQPAGLAVAKTGGGTTGLGYIFVPTVLTGGPLPNPILTVADTSTTLVIVTMSVSRTDAVSGLIDVSREPIGIVVRYQ
jgi:hypothetical protein